MKPSFPLIPLSLLPKGRETVGWELIASILTVARFCQQRSELEIAERWYADSVLEDLAGVRWEQVNEARLYRGLDVLYEHKETLCKHLMKRYESMFGVDFEFLLYDVTSTFFEGKAQANNKAAHGYSRDKRPDGKQVCIGLVCTPEGLPLAFEIFNGNRKDSTTVQEIVEKMEKQYGQARRVWVLDRGMVSEANLEFLRQRQARYIVGTSKSQLKAYEKELLEKSDWHEVQPGVEVKLLPQPDGAGTEQFILCRSHSRREKERAMLEKQRQRLLGKLEEIDASLCKRPAKDLEKLGRRIGRWLGRNTLAEKTLRVSILKNEAGHARGLDIKTHLPQDEWMRHIHGAYLLRTNCPEKDPSALWRWYMQLQQAEACFRLGKDDLNLRPIYHQKTERVEAHILICFLSLALWRTLEMWMKAKGLGTCARQLIKEISTIRSMDVILPMSTGEELRLRVVSKPDKMVAELLYHLGLELPQAPKMIENVV